MESPGAAEHFVNRSPRLKRLEAERQDLLDAIRQAQLLLSVKRCRPAEILPTPESSLLLEIKRARDVREIELPMDGRHNRS